MFLDKPAAPHLVQTSHSDFRPETTCNYNGFEEDRPPAVAHPISSFFLAEGIVGMSTTTKRWTRGKTSHWRTTFGVAFHWHSMMRRRVLTFSTLFLVFVMRWAFFAFNLWSNHLQSEEVVVVRVWRGVLCWREEHVGRWDKEFLERTRKSCSFPFFHQVNKSYNKAYCISFLSRVWKNEFLAPFENTLSK